MNNEYYILEGGERLGPFTARDLMDKPLEPTDMVLLPMQTQAVVAYELDEFTNYFKSEGIYYPTAINTNSYLLRLPAYVIDYFIIVFGVVILALIAVPGYILKFEQEVVPVPFDSQKYMENLTRYSSVMLFITVGVFIVTILYNVFCEASSLRGSVGKYVMGLAVVDESGYALTFKQALKRNTAKIVYLVSSFVISIFAYLFYLRMIWSDRHQAFHDQVSGCYIVKKNA